MKNFMKYSARVLKLIANVIPFVIPAQAGIHKLFNGFRVRARNDKFVRTISKYVKRTALYISKFLPPTYLVRVAAVTAIVFLLSLPALDTLYQNFNHTPWSKILAGYSSIKNSASDTYRFEAANIDLKAFFGDKKYPDSHRFAILKNGSKFDLRLTEGDHKCPQNSTGCNVLDDAPKPKTAQNIIDFQGLQNIPQTADLARNLQQQLDELQKNQPSGSEDNVIRSADLISGNPNDKVRFLRSQANRDLQVHYEIIDQGVKQTLALDRNSLPTYQFLLNLDGLQVIKTAANSYLLLNTERTTVIQISRPIIRDGSGHEGSGQINIFQEPRGIIMEIGVDQKWFADPNRQYPITIETQFIIGGQDQLIKKIDDTLDKLGQLQTGTLKVIQGRTKNFEYENTNSNFYVGFGDKDRAKSKVVFSSAAQPDTGIEMALLDEHPDIAIRKNTKLESEENLLEDLKVFQGHTLGSNMQLVANSQSKQTLVDSVEITRAKSNVDLEYKVFPQGLKENIILTAPPASASGQLADSTFEYALNVVGLTPKKDSDGIWQFYPKTDPTARPLFSFAQPFAEDAAGIRNDNVVIDIKPGNNCQKTLGQLTGADSACYRLTVTADQKWLTDPNRAYPVKIDPTITDNTSSLFSTNPTTSTNSVKNRVFDTGSGASPQLEGYYHELPTDNNTVGLWHMNETSGAPVADSSGNSNTGTSSSTSNVTTTAQRLGAAARTFNGTSDYVSMGNVSALNFERTNSFTVEAWIKKSSAASNIIVSKQLAAGNFTGWGFYSLSTGILQLNLTNIDTTNDLVMRTTSTALSDLNWHHVAVTYDGSSSANGVRMYIDGVSDSLTTVRSALSASIQSAANVNIGARNGTDQFFAGTIDEVRVSNVVRAPEEIKMDAQRSPYALFSSAVLDLTNLARSFNSLSWSQNGVKTGDGETLFSTTSLVAQWNFNSTSGTTATNDAGSCGASCNGTLTNFASTASQDQAAGTGWTANDKRWGAGALNFSDAATADLVSLADPATNQLDPNSSDFSFEIWIKTTDTSAEIFSNNNANGTACTNNGYRVGIDANGFPTFYLDTNGVTAGCNLSITGNVKINDGNWHYLAVTALTAGGTATMYLDGVAIQTATGTAYSAITVTGTVYFGGSVGGLSATLDGTRFYSRALTATEIVSNYNAGNVQFQTRTGATTNPNDGTWEAWKPTTSETQIDSMDGSYQYNTTDTGLVSYWPLDDTNASGGTTADVKGVNTGTLYGTRVVDGKFGKARKFNGSSDYVSVGALTGGTALQSVEFWAYPTSTTNYFVDLNGTAYISATTGTVSATGFTSPTIYVNGVVSSTIVANQWQYIVVTTGTGLNASAFNIGKISTNYLAGMIDEVRVYSSALSAATIQSHFTEGAKLAGLQNINSSSDSNLKIEGTRSQKHSIGAPKVDANTVGLWHLDETKGNPKFITDTNSSLTTSLTSYWNCNEASGIRYDQKGTNDLTDNATVTTNPGKQGNACQFTAANSEYLSKTDTADLSVGAVDFSISAWVYMDSKPANNMYVVAKSSEYRLYWSQPDDRFIFETAGIGPSTLIKADSLGVPALSTWYHIVAWHDATAKTINIKVNNGTTDTYTYSTGSPADGAANFNIGSYSGINQFWNGRIDEIGFWRKVLSTQEITDLYNSSSADPYTNGGAYIKDARGGNFSTDNMGTLSQNLSAYWNLNEVTATTAYDSFGTSNGTSTGTTVAAGKLSNARTFNGSSDYIDAGASSVFAPSGDITISAWIKTTVSPTGDVAIAGKGGDSNTQYQLRMTGSIDGAGKLKFSHFNGSWYEAISTSTYNNGTWHHVVGVNSSGTLYLYVDGTQVASAPVTWGTASTGNFLIGARSSATKDIYFSGSIDEVGVWSRALSQQEITDLYNAGTGQTYSGGGGLNGTVAGTSTTPSSGNGMDGKAMNFNGTSNLIDVGNISSLDFDNTSPFSIEAWIKLNTDSVTSTVICKKFNSGSFTGWCFQRVSNNVLQFTLTNTASTNEIVVRSTSTVTADSKWHYVAATYSGSGAASGVAIYIDGVANTPSVVTNNLSATTKNSSHVNIGAQDNAVNYANGIIDELRVSNVVRTANEIAETFRAGRDHRIGKTISSTDLSAQQRLPFYVASDRQGTFAQSTIGNSQYANYEPDTNTKALWRFEEQTGTANTFLLDSSGSSHNPTTISGTTYTQGKIGKARSFNGSSDYIEIPDSSDWIVSTNTFSIDLWVKLNSTAALQSFVSQSDASNYWLLNFDNTVGLNFGGNYGGVQNINEGTAAAWDTNWHHVAFVSDGTNFNLYKDGMLVAKAARTADFTDRAGPLTIGSQHYTGGVNRYFTNGTLDEVRISNVARTADQIRQAFEVGARSHNITIDFKANLLSTDLITSSADLGFNIDSTAYGAQNKGDNLYLGDKIIVKENVAGTEYIAQGTVNAVNDSTGAVTVTAWDAGSTFPTGGFTASATVFKWQREYFDITGSLSTQRNAITTITLRPLDTSQGLNVWLDDLKYSGNYLNTTAGSTITSTIQRYVQYRAIFSASDPAVSGNITSATIDYNTGPSTDQRLRNGLWFNFGAKQGFFL